MEVVIRAEIRSCADYDTDIIGLAIEKKFDGMDRTNRDQTGSSDSRVKCQPILFILFFLSNILQIF